MKKIYLAAVILISFGISACKIQIDSPDQGGVTTVSGAYECNAGESCTIDVSDLFFDEEFVAVPVEGYKFIGWERKDRSFCGDSIMSCRLYTSAFDGVPVLMNFLETMDEVFYLTPTFLEQETTLEELTGRTVYAVAFVGGGDDPDFAEAVKIEFKVDGTAVYKEILNQLYEGQVAYAFAENGFLYFDGDASAGYELCEFTESYVKVYRVEDGAFDNDELWFFDRAEALAYARGLEGPVPGCI